MREAMTVNERFHAAMNFQPFDRLPLLEWAPWWDKTIERWQGEGLPAGLTDRDDLLRHFGLDVHKQDWFWTINARLPELPGGGFIRTMDDYLAIRDKLYPSYFPDAKWIGWAKEQKKGDIITWFTFNGFFWFPRELFGIEQHLYAFYEQPEVMHRINKDLSEWMLTVIDKLVKICTPDFMTFAEDMSYNMGPMISRELFDEYMLPYYHKVIPRLREYGILPIIDSDGDVTLPAPWFENAGIAGILPLERQAHVDIAQLRETHPDMRFIGHFDKMTMPLGEEAMRNEFERLLPVARKGGFLISCDHQTPPGVSLENYLTYVRLFREYAVRAGTI